MKTFTAFFVLILTAGVFSSFAPTAEPDAAPEWEIDKNHSSVAFSIRHYFSDVVGTFDDFEGTLKFDPNDLSTSMVDFTIDVSTVNTRNERRDNHLKSGDFFNVEEFPSMSFKSTNIVKDGDHYKATGDFTIRDVTKTIEIPIEFLGEMAHPRNEGAFLGGFSSEFTVDRTEYGVGSGNFLATTTIGGEVTVKINVEATRGGE